MSDKKGCEGCKFLCRRDGGYSNYTVEYTSLDCLKNLNPKMPCDDQAIDARLEPVLAFGETCPGFVAGDGPWFDVEGGVTIEDYKDDPEVYDLLKEDAARERVLSSLRAWVPGHCWLTLDADLALIEVGAARKERERLMPWLEHRPDCKSWRGNPCLCGLTAALEAR